MNAKRARRRRESRSRRRRRWLKEEGGEGEVGEQGGDVGEGQCHRAGSDFGVELEPVQQSRDAKSKAASRAPRQSQTISPTSVPQAPPRRNAVPSSRENARANQRKVGRIDRSA